jgi:hypothetical protein
MAALAIIVSQILGVSMGFRCKMSKFTFACAIFCARLSSLYVLKFTEFLHTTSFSVVQLRIQLLNWLRGRTHYERELSTRNACFFCPLIPPPAGLGVQCFLMSVICTGDWLLLLSKLIYPVFTKTKNKCPSDRLFYKLHLPKQKFTSPKKKSGSGKWCFSGNCMKYRCFVLSLYHVYIENVWSTMIYTFSVKFLWKLFLWNMCHFLYKNCQLYKLTCKIICLIIEKN